MHSPFSSFARTCAVFSIAIAVVSSPADAGKRRREAAGMLQPYAFFKNSTRREPKPEEQSLVVKLGSGCTGFFVRNDQRRTLLMTARHCVNMSITNWCSSDGKVTDTNGEVGKCTKIIAADTSHDIALFEAAFSYTPTDAQSLVLGTFAPDVGQRLVMIGYPVDKFRLKKLTTSEDCWITEKHVASPHGATMNDASAKHNCTTYGGNSGGPMIAEGTDIAVGLPFTYYPNHYFEYEEDDVANHAKMAQMADFASVHSTELTSAGVETASKIQAPRVMPGPPIP